jgi:hypothetical protein
MNNSPYLDQPLFPLAVVLPRMLASIEIELGTAGLRERPRLRERAELVQRLLSGAEAGLRSPA